MVQNSFFDRNHLVFHTILEKDFFLILVSTELVELNVTLITFKQDLLDNWALFTKWIEIIATDSISQGNLNHEGSASVTV